MFCKKIINASFEFLSVADSLRNRRPYWIENLLCPSPCWGVGVTVEILIWRIQPGGHYGCVDVLWHGAVPDRLAYLPWGLENVRATVHRVHDNLL